MPLVLRNCDPPPEALARGFEAAHAVLSAAGITPQSAWLQSGYHVAWTDATAMRAWYRAEDACVRAAFGSWRGAPLAVAMEWEPDAEGERCES
jgi:hypothetical protein